MDLGRSLCSDDVSDYDLALKFFLRATEMETDPGNLDLRKTSTRSWWGVKLVSAMAPCSDLVTR